MRKILFIFLMISLGMVQAWAQKTCVIASGEDHVPIREALIHTDNNHWARTDYRGYFNMRYPFDSATVSKPGYVKTTIRYETLPDTVFLLPEAKQIGEVTVWGKNMEHIDEMEKNIKNKIQESPQPITGIGFNAFGWMDKQANRDRKHLKQAQKIFKEMDRRDPVVAAYEKVTGKKYAKKTDYESELEAQDSVQAEKQKPTTLQKTASVALGAAVGVDDVVLDTKAAEAQMPDLYKKEK